jgi:hypothetical protein
VKYWKIEEDTVNKIVENKEKGENTMKRGGQN